jgi:hypothetical protein
MVKRLGVIVDKIVTVLSFKQSYHMKDYILKCMEDKTNAAPGSTARAVAKSASNSVYGKTCQNSRNFKNFIVCFSDEEFEKRMRNPLVRSWTKLADGLTILEVDKVKVESDSPIAIGFQILSLAKLYNFEIYYDKLYPHIMKPVDDHPDEFPLCRLFYVDTDAMVISLSKRAQERLLACKDLWFNFSEYPEKEKLHNTKNKKEIGVLTDEFNGNNPKEAVYIRPKCYSTIDDDEKRKTSCKGVPKRNVPSHDDYKSCLVDRKCFNVTIASINSVNKQNYLILTDKRALTPMSMKRYFTDFDTSLPFGHYSLHNPAISSQLSENLTKIDSLVRPALPPRPPKRKRINKYNKIRVFKKFKKV